MTLEPEPVVSIVDDDDAVRDSLCLLLESHGMTVQGYESAEAFLGQANPQNSDCLIFDLHMPGMTGLELAEALRALGSPTPILIITGRNDPSLTSRVKNADVMAVLSKPIGYGDLAEWIDRARASRP